MPRSAADAGETVFSSFNVTGPIANLLIGAGILLVIAGLLAKTGLLGWFGHLPGDIQIKRENFQLYLPVTSMILVSVLVSGLLALIRRLG